MINKYIGNEMFKWLYLTLIFITNKYYLVNSVKSVSTELGYIKEGSVKTIIHNVFKMSQWTFNV